MLFRLIDKDNSGEIDCQEFVDGCTDLKGTLVAIEFAIFNVEFQNMKELLFEHVRKMDIHTKRLDSQVRQLADQFNETRSGRWEIL
jgi:Ca2+-binding EF-hand superfamily protein